MLVYATTNFSTLAFCQTNSSIPAWDYTWWLTFKFLKSVDNWRIHRCWLEGSTWRSKKCQWLPHLSRGNLISWSSTKQKLVSRSSAESKYRGLVLATVEIIWIQALLQELCVPTPVVPILWYDNISAYHMAKHFVFHTRTKHIEIDLHFIRYQVLQGKIELQFVPTEG
jgi:hypothetical protein